ncbi:MAG: LytTR family DNA-binding domain-containing protein [Oscillospiraceae bacterium]
MKIAIVDDSFNDRAQLVSDIERYALEHIVPIKITQFESGEIFLSKAQPCSFDLVFLDIYMVEMSGMDVAQAIRDQNADCQIVFISSSAAFAVDSYKVNALYYLLKPYNYDELAIVLTRIVNATKKTLRFITVKDGREQKKILLSDILYADYSNHYVQIHTEAALIRGYMNFSEIEEMLLCYKEFLACYRCIVVNMNKIKKVVDLYFLLSNGEYIPINRKQAREIKTHYSDYIFGLLEGGEEDAH